jgi:hypothetical protein
MYALSNSFLDDANAVLLEHCLHLVGIVRTVDASAIAET